MTTSRPIADPIIEVRDNQQRRSSVAPFTDEEMSYRSLWEKTTFLGILHFTFIIPFFKLTKRKKDSKITLEDLPRLGRTERVEAFDKKLMKNYIDQSITRSDKPRSIIRAILSTYLKEIIFQFIYQIIFFGLRLAYGYFLYHLLVSLADPSTTVREGFKAAIGLFVSMVISMYASQQAYFNNYNLVTKVKITIVSLIYKKINKVSLYSLNQLSIGTIINIVANDINSFDKFFNIFALCLMPFVFGGGIAIMMVLYGPIALTGFAFILLTFPFQMKLAKSSSPIRKEKNKITDERVKFTNEIIDTIRLLKMYAWEMTFKKRVEDLREKEINLLKRLAYREGGQRVLAFSAISGSSFIIFLSYTLNGGTLSIALVYSTIFLMQIVAMYGVFIPAMGIAFLIESKLTFRRIEQILDLPEIEALAYDKPTNTENAIEFKDFSGFWELNNKQEDKMINKNTQTALDILKIKSSKSVEEAKDVLKQVRQASVNTIELGDKPHREILEEKNKLPGEEKFGRQHHVKQSDPSFDGAVLKNINLNVKANSLTAIVGRVGSGKSTLLLSLTGEMPRLEGTLKFSGKIAYVEQEPTIFSGTLRENITFGLDFEPGFYAQVVMACSLKNDFRAFPMRDLTEIGEKGITLSGGQKARVALARALYSRADIYLLDDPLSAVDTKVAKRLYEDAIKGFLHNKTVLLATHQVHFVRDADEIIVMDEGRIAALGTYEDLQRQGIALEAIAEENKEVDQQVKEEAHAAHEVEDELDDEFKEEAAIINKPGGLFGDEDTISGKVTWSTYKEYLKVCITKGRGTILLILLVGTECLNISYGRVVGVWGQGDLRRNVALGVSGGLAIITYFFFFGKVVFYNKATLRGSGKLHNNMLNVVMKKKVEFFDTNPIGRILSRFSHDAGIMDKILPQYLLDILEGNIYLFALYIVVWVINPWVIISGVATLVVMFFVIKITTPTVVIARQLELISRSPMYSFFSLTLSGLIAVRSFGQVDTFNRKFTNMVNVFARANYTFWHTSRFMSMLIDYTSTIGCLVGLSIYIATKDQTSPSWIGQGALYLLLLNEQVQWILRQTINVNLFMASAARMLDYSKVKDQEGPLELSTDIELKNAGWPREGQINFNNIYMRYRPTTEYIIKGISFNVKPGEKIGCVGRTGAGKSSILQMLFRMVEIDRSVEGDSTSLTIDNVDIKDVGLHTLRKNISIIPQTPVIFSGTIRKNLDPLDEKSDLELWKALEEVNLKEAIEKLENKLGTDMSNANQVFSVGQKQLVCLARAILKKSKIIVLDEATANVDFETDSFIQHTIMDKFKDCTVFTIAHRLSTIANYDKVLVMDKGKIAEFDAPYKLLVNALEDGNISKTNGVFASMVLNTGETASKHIYEMAKHKYYGEEKQEALEMQL